MKASMQTLLVTMLLKTQCCNGIGVYLVQYYVIMLNVFFSSIQYIQLQNNSESVATFSLPAGLAYPVQIPAGVTLQTASGKKSLNLLLN